MGIGTLTGYEARITLRQAAVPKFHKTRPVPCALYSKVHEELHRFQQEGIIRQINRCEWASPIVVRKAVGSIKVSGDYKVSVNPYLETECYPMPNPQDLFSNLPRKESLLVWT